MQNEELPESQLTGLSIRTSTENEFTSLFDGKSELTRVDHSVVLQIVSLLERAERAGFPSRDFRRRSGRESDSPSQRGQGVVTSLHSVSLIELTWMQSAS